MSVKTYCNKHAWWISVPLFSLISVIIIWLLSNVSFDVCQLKGYTINQTQTPMSLTPIELDRAKYAVGQIVHISHIQNNSDTKNVTKYSVSSAEHRFDIVNISQNPYDSAGENVTEYLEINRTHYPSPFIVLKYPFIKLGCYEPFTQEQNTFALIELDNLRSNYTFIPNQPGLYIISTYSTNSTSNDLQQQQQKEFKTIFEVINPVKSSTFIMLIIAIGFFIAIVFLTFKLSKQIKILNDKKINNDVLKTMEVNYQNKIKWIEVNYQSDRKMIKENYQSEIKTNKEIKKIEEKYQSERKMIEETYQSERKMIKENYQREIKPIEESYQRNMYDYIEIAGSIRFLFISALVWSLILALVFTEVEIGTQSPLGLVLRHNLNPEGNELDVTKNPLIEWGINIGGNWENNFSSGVVIPFYVLILGLVGGYLRYLQKTTSKEKISSKEKIYEKTEKPIEGTSTEYQETKYKKPMESTSLEFQETTYGELSNIFLAPLLAAVIWFILSQGETEFNIYGMAAISFSIGLVTKEIIQIIVKFMERVVPPEK
jgi:hypothetical protein